MKRMKNLYNMNEVDDTLGLYYSREEECKKSGSDPFGREYKRGYRGVGDDNRLGNEKSENKWYKAEGDAGQSYCIPSTEVLCTIITFKKLNFNLTLSWVENVYD